MLPSFMFLAQFYITNDYMSGNSMEILGSRKKKILSFSEFFVLNAFSTNISLYLCATILGV